MAARQGAARSGGAPWLHFLHPFPASSASPLSSPNPHQAGRERPEPRQGVQWRGRGLGVGGGETSWLWGAV